MSVLHGNDSRRYGRVGAFLVPCIVTSSSLYCFWCTRHQTNKKLTHSPVEGTGIQKRNCHSRSKIFPVSHPFPIKFACMERTSPNGYICWLDQGEECSRRGTDACNQAHSSIGSVIGSMIVKLVSLLDSLSCCCVLLLSMRFALIAL